MNSTRSWFQAVLIVAMAAFAWPAAAQTTSTTSTTINSSTSYASLLVGSVSSPGPTLTIASPGLIDITTASVTSFTVGSNANPYAAVVQQSGTVTSQGGIFLGRNTVNGDTTYTGSAPCALQGGSILLSNATNGILAIGSSSAATFMQSGGSITAARSGALSIGIAGACTSSTNFSEPTGRGRCVSNDNYGVSCWNGAFRPNRSLSVDQMLDGTSSTVMIAEQSDWATSSSGQQVEARTTARRGCWIGARLPTFPGDDTANWVLASNGFGAPYAVSTVRYAIGYKTEATGGLGNHLLWSNTAIQSAHPQGASVPRADGGTWFLLESTAPEVLRNLCIRDDGQVASFDGL